MRARRRQPEKRPAHKACKPPGSSRDLRLFEGYP